MAGGLAEEVIGGKCGVGCGWDCLLHDLVLRIRVLVRLVLVLRDSHVVVAMGGGYNGHVGQWAPLDYPGTRPCTGLGGLVRHDVVCARQWLGDMAGKLLLFV